MNKENESKMLKQVTFCMYFWTFDRGTRIIQNDSKKPKITYYYLVYIE